MNEYLCRKAFESESRKQGYTVTKNNKGEYEDYHLRVAFPFYQSAWNLRQPVLTVEEIDDIIINIIVKSGTGFTHQDMSQAIHNAMMEKQK